MTFSAGQLGREASIAFGVNMKNILTVAVIMFLSSVAVGQEKQNPTSNSGVITEQRVVNLPVFRRPRPTISLQRALKLAESEMKKQDLTASQYYLVEAKYTSLEIESNSVPCWRFLWVAGNSQRSAGHDIEAYVFMSGRVWLPPMM